jgi:hypothetical protein
MLDSSIFLLSRIFLESIGAYQGTTKHDKLTRKQEARKNRDKKMTFIVRVGRSAILFLLIGISIFILSAETVSKSQIIFIF